MYKTIHTELVDYCHSESFQPLEMDRRGKEGGGIPAHTY